MKRRTFVYAAVALLTQVRGAAGAQQKKPRRIAFVYFGSRQSAEETGRYAAFREGMRAAGFSEGKDFVIEARYANGDARQFTPLALEAVGSKPDVIVSTVTAMHAVFLKATQTIPIVMTVAADPVAQGVAISLSRPGKNITGMTSVNAELSHKYSEVLTDTLPRLKRVGVLYTTTNPSHAEQVENVRRAITKHRLHAQPIDVARLSDIGEAFDRFAREKTDAAIVVADGLFVQHAREIAELALKHRLPVMYATSEHPDAGGLMSYGADIRENYRRAAAYVSRIFRGAKPAELPIEQPSKFEFVINLKAAAALGLVIPKSVLFRADRVIE